jgi:non-heme chloroperoxidase
VDPGFVRRFQESTLAQRVPQAFLQTMIRESLKVPARVWRAATEALLEDDHTEELNKIVAPTLILWGDSDLLTRDDQETLAEAIVGSRRVVYPGGGHTLYWEEPGRVASDLAAFIEGLASHPGGATDHAA